MILGLVAVGLSLVACQEGDAEPAVVDTSGCDDPPTWYADADDDGFGDALVPLDHCVAPEGYVADATDCNDDAPFANPGGVEACNLIDDDCDGVTDELATDATRWYADRDGDAFGDPDDSEVACQAPADTVADGTDCDDGQPTVYPGAYEYLSDGLDNDCDGVVDG
jgi:hypothetical protein